MSESPDNAEPGAGRTDERGREEAAMRAARDRAAARGLDVSVAGFMWAAAIIGVLLLVFVAIGKLPHPIMELIGRILFAVGAGWLVIRSAILSAHHLIDTRE